ncbi:MAG: hypothetical protein Q4D13_05550 [Erysipelotrichaceae bacterium]|nr:hypothetical protein [Erysipelotrichaceae bacterium]
MDIQELRDGWMFMAQGLGDETVNKTSFADYHDNIQFQRLQEINRAVDRMYGSDIRLPANMPLNEVKKYAGEKLFIDPAQMDYLNNALDASITAATITMITEMAPELYRAIDYLIKNGEIDLSGLKQRGKKAISDGGESFLRGSIAYVVEMGIQHGMLGEGIRYANTSAVGAVVCVIYETIKDTILVASGQMEAHEMGMKFVESVIISTTFFVSMEIGGAVMQALVPELPIIAYAIGSFVGCSIAIVYNIAKNKFISFCADTGFTCFGIVEQDYAIPEELLNKLGISTIEIHKTDIHTVNISTANISTYNNQKNYETIDIFVLKRGLIGVNKVGYVLE